MKPKKLIDCLSIFFCKRHAEPPNEIILDVDATDDPLHGNQEGRFLSRLLHELLAICPLYFLWGVLLCARLRSSNIDASEGTVEELERIVAQIRNAGPV